MKDTTCGKLAAHRCRGQVGLTHAELGFQVRESGLLIADTPFTADCWPAAINMGVQADRGSSFTVCSVEGCGVCTDGGP